MPTPPYASLLIKKNAGAPGYGPVTAVNGDTITLSAENVAYWNQSGRFEIRAYPDGFAAPAGWSTAADGTYFWLGTGPAPAITLPAGPTFGKWLFGLHVNGGALYNAQGQVVARGELTDLTAGVKILGPNGEEDLAVGETTQFHAQGWPKAVQVNVRLQAAGGGGGGGDMTANSIRLDSYVAVGDGSEVATAGGWRAKDADSQMARTGDLANNASIWSWLSDALALGDWTYALSTFIHAKAGGAIGFALGMTEKLRVNAAGILLASSSDIKKTSGPLGLLTDGDTVYLEGGPSGAVKTSFFVRRSDDASQGQLAIYDGTNGYMWRKFDPIVNTADATVTTLWAFTLTDNKTYTIQAWVTADDSGGANSGGYVRAVTVKRAGGGATLVGSVTAVHTAEDSAGWDCTFDVSGNDVRLRVTGAAATNINWSANVDVCGRGG